MSKQAGTAKIETGSRILAIRLLPHLFKKANGRARRDIQ
jgi:hypothetical protein